MMDRNAKGKKALDAFHPLVRRWFVERFGEVTPVQEGAWDQIGKGGHVLITAPTGSGKTLAAFLWMIDRLISGVFLEGVTHLVYVSPLKALNNDMQKNLLVPLAELKALFEAENVPFPSIRVKTRSGDTPQSERRKMLKHPPEILITTPESLNLILTSKRGALALLGEIKAVILDEIHAVAGNKRGTYLISAVERLTLFSGEFQRIALSASIHPIEVLADFMGGYCLEDEGISPTYEKRAVSLVAPAIDKSYEVFIRQPEELDTAKDENAYWKPFAKACFDILIKNRSTLIFVQSRKLCEKLTALINDFAKETIAYAHHGSLSKSLRLLVEQKLKNGDLKAIVSTSSLELGIDIGALDEVILIQSPFSVSSALQRIGRSGHSVGKISKSSFFPGHDHDILTAAVILKAVLKKEIEPTKPLICPLDVLAQIIVSMVVYETWHMDDLFAFVKTAYPFHKLSRKAYDGVLDMLSGSYENQRIRQLTPKIVIDRMDQTITAKKGAALHFYLSGGVIADRGYFTLRHHITQAAIGELDEEFVWEAKVGQVFTLGTQYWRVEKMTQKDVFVSPSTSHAISPPFWKSEEGGRDFHLSHRLGGFLETMDHLIETSSDDADTASKDQEMADEYQMETALFNRLKTYLTSQRELFDGHLPHRSHVICEHTRSGLEKGPGHLIILHTFWGKKVNHPLSLIFGEQIKETFNFIAEVYPGDDAIVIMTEKTFSVSDLFSQIESDNMVSIIYKALVGTGIFGAVFRESAGRALMLPGKKFKQRMPLWLSRLHAKKLFDSVKEYEDFPLMAESFRTIMADIFDLDALKQIVREFQNGEITLSNAHLPSISPMARGGAWQQINLYMYQDDTPDASLDKEFKGDWLEEFLFKGLKALPVLQTDVDDFVTKRHRLASGYSPESAIELFAWVKERLLIPIEEWEKLLASILRDHGVDSENLLNELITKLVLIYPEGEALPPLIATKEQCYELSLSFHWDVSEMVVKDILGNATLTDWNQPTGDAPKMADSETLSQWISFYGPLSQKFIKETLLIEETALDAMIAVLKADQRLILGQLIEGRKEVLLCDTENYQRLIRLARKKASLGIKPRDIRYLPLFLAHFQGITHAKSGESSLLGALSPLYCHSLPYDLWEKEVLPARISDYHPLWLDALMQTGHLLWLGEKDQKIAFLEEEDLYLLKSDLSSDLPEASEGRSEMDGLLPDSDARYPFPALLKVTGLEREKLSEQLWDQAFKGWISNDTMVSLRYLSNQKGPLKVATNTAFKARHRTTRRQFHHRRRGRGKGISEGIPGNWFVIPQPEASMDMMEDEEIKKDRIRLLLDRYGIIFREIVENESPVFKWSAIFKTLRFMELAGEVIGGYFFHPLKGPQFISKKSLKMMTSPLPEDAIFWINAKDPASLLGLIPLPLVSNNTTGKNDKKDFSENASGIKLPPRLKSCHIVYHGTGVVMISRKSGKQLDIFCPYDHPDITSYFQVLMHLLTRKTDPMPHITIEQINAKRVDESPFLEVLKKMFEVVLSYRKVTLYKK